MPTIMAFAEYPGHHLLINNTSFSFNFKLKGKQENQTDITEWIWNDPLDDITAVQ